nr:MAG TPA: portal protein [Caudoviricetes sp.]
MPDDFDKKITPEQVQAEYQKMLGYNTAVNLDETVRANENFFIGKQWEGVDAKGLPTPVYNFLKQVVLFSVANITTDNIKMQATPLACERTPEDVERVAEIVNKEFDRLFEFNRVPNLVREYMRNAAVDGDSCLFTFWDDTVDAGFGLRGGIRTEIVDNMRVGFGNTACRDPQKQPYILIERREMTKELRRAAQEAGNPRWGDIQPDTENHNTDSYKNSSERSTVLLRMWKERKTGTVWACEVSGRVMLREPWDMGLRLYPVTWINWDYIPDSYHGQALVTGLIPNQIFVNKLFAMSMISLMTSAFPRTVYDKTRIPKWNNAVGAAIGVNGGDVSGVAKIIDPAQISPQIAQFIQTSVDYTRQFLGATSAALGETRPDNTSAIIALQRAASIPSEITKQNLYKSIEDLGRIYLDFMAAYYGKRKVQVSMPDVGADILAFAGKDPEELETVLFDYGILNDMPMALKLDVGASSYWSEMASVQTLDNLLMQDKITIEEYLERIPDGYIPKRQELIASRKQAAQQQMMQPEEQSTGGTPETGDLVDLGRKTPIRGGGGFGDLQRKVMQTGTAE